MVARGLFRAVALLTIISPAAAFLPASLNVKKVSARVANYPVESKISFRIFNISELRS